MKKIFILPIFLLTYSFSFYGCITYTCDGSIRYAMKKERDVIRTRINDMIHTLSKITKETEINNHLMVKESLELLRLRQRYRIRLKDSMQQTYNLDTLTHTIDAGASLQTVINQIHSTKIGGRE